jgi:hypothetical protein
LIVRPVRLRDLIQMICQITYPMDQEEYTDGNED